MLVFTNIHVYNLISRPKAGNIPSLCVHCGAQSCVMGVEELRIILESKSQKINVSKVHLSRQFC